MPLTDSPRANALAPQFEQRMQTIRERFFGRNPRYWPAFADPAFARAIDFRRKHLPPDQRVAAWPGGADLARRLRTDSAVPERMQDMDQPPADLLTFAAALSKDWEDPASVENVVSMPSDPGIAGSMLGLLANANLVHPEYSEMANELEHNVVRQIATLSGYDPQQATGIFTQGGTFCNLYGYLLGIRKSLPDSRLVGLEHGHDYRIINSQGGHYSNTTNLSLLGVNIRRKTIRIRITDDNDMDLQDLERQLKACFRLNCVVPAIMLTMGTTDTFGVDRVKPVHDLLTRLCAEFRIPVRPHIHVDSAVGWPILFFCDYDFTANPLHINEATLAGLHRNAERFREMRYADSFTVDFQKWGYVPYTSSLVMIRNAADLRALENDPENFGYFERDTQGQTHLHSTIECSRGAAGVFGAWAALHYLGMEGYRTLIANSLQNANWFRQRLSQQPGVRIMARRNQGPSAGFRMYDPDKVKDAEAEHRYERAFAGTEEWAARVNANSAWHRTAFKRRGKTGLYTNWVQFIAHTSYGPNGDYRAIPGEKAVFMNPLTTRANIDAFIARLRG